ncbi:hypothetical protein V6Z11_A08G053700 [Gossypium hirsutum]
MKSAILLQLLGAHVTSAASKVFNCMQVSYARCPRIVISCPFLPILFTMLALSDSKTTL